MKKIVIVAFFVFFGLSSFAQKFAYVDSEYILNQMPEYKSAQNQLKSLSEQWQKQVDQRFTEIDKLYKAYQADQVLLTDDMRKRRENEIIEKEKEAKDLQRRLFGPEGELFQNQAKLLTPIQDKVTKAVAEIAKAKFLDFIFDKNSEATMMIYSSAAYDLSNDVITRLGYKPNTTVK